jgi:hypothetical protein
VVNVGNDGNISDILHLDFIYKFIFGAAKLAKIVGVSTMMPKYNVKLGLDFANINLKITWKMNRGMM